MPTSLVLGLASFFAGQAAVAPGRAAPIDRSFVTRRCAPATATRDEWEDIEPGSRCRVSAFRRIPGSLPSLYYQKQEYRAPGTRDWQGTGIALLSAVPGRSTFTLLAGWSGSNATIGPPRMVRTRQATLVVIPMSAPVSSVPMNDVALRVMKGGWSLVSMDKWNVVIPAGVEQWHGNAVDWPSLRVFGALWKPGDHGCCPTGGSYIAQLRLDGGTLRVASVRYSKQLLVFP